MNLKMWLFEDLYHRRDGGLDSRVQLHSIVFLWLRVNKNMSLKSMDILSGGVSLLLELLGF